MKKYKAIGFDHTGVIVGKSAIKFNQDICDILNINLDTLMDAYLTHNQDFILGKITKKELWEKTLFDVNKISFLEKIMEKMSGPKITNNNVISLIHELRRKGYKLGLLSNDTTGDYETIRSVEHLDKIFDVLSISAETKLVKPNRDAFEEFANKLQVDFSELVYIDDSKNIIDAANKLGIKGILCTDPDLLKGQLKEIGVI